MPDKQPDWTKCVLCLVPDQHGAMFDMSPRLNHAVDPHGLTPLVNEGLNINKSLEFNRTLNHQLIIPADTSHEITEFTVVYLFKPVWDAGSNSYNLLRKDGVGAERFSTFISQINKKMSIYFSGLPTTPPYVYKENKWYVFGLSVEPGGAPLTTYNNGVLDFTGGTVGTYTGAPGINLTISLDASIYSFNGNLQYALMFNYALNAAEHTYLNKYLRTITWLPKGVR